MGVDYPKTGRIGRFAKIVLSELGPAKSSKVLQRAMEYDSYSPKEKSSWWRNAVDTMEKLIGRDASIGVMRQCGAKCCGDGQRRTARMLFVESASLAAFLKKLERHDVKDGDLTYTLKDDHTIIAEHNKCFCKQVASASDPFKSSAYCHCSVEFNKRFFSAALSVEVAVDLGQSIIMGAPSCRFIVTIPGGDHA